MPKWLIFFVPAFAQSCEPDPLWGWLKELKDWLFGSGSGCEKTCTALEFEQECNALIAARNSECLEAGYYYGGIFNCVANSCGCVVRVDGGCKNSLPIYNLFEGAEGEWF